MSSGLQQTTINTHFRNLNSTLQSSNHVGSEHQEHDERDAVIVDDFDAVDLQGANFIGNESD